MAIGKRVKVTRNHQTTVPKEAREKFGIEIGSVLEFRVRHRFGTESHRESVRPRVRRFLEDGREGLGGLPVSWLRIGAREASGLRENAHPRTQIRPLPSLTYTIGFSASVERETFLRPTSSAHISAHLGTSS